MNGGRYTASRALQKFDARITTDDDEAERARLLEAVAAETAVNSTELELATGQAATFGGESTALSPLPLIFSYKSEKSLFETGTYQLLNRSSGKYLQAKKTVADEDPTALRCSMGDAAVRSKMPWFSIQPGFRTRSEGEDVRMGDTVVLQSMKMPGLYVHTSMEEDGREVAEVNIFDTATVREPSHACLSLAWSWPTQ